MNDQKIDALVSVINEKVEHHCNRLNWAPQGACPAYAAVAATELREHGLEAIVVGGTLQWPRVTEEMDDGVMDTHFSYEFELSPVTENRLAQGLLPEMHCWVWVPETQRVLDLTTRYLPAQCSRLSQMEWLSPTPPPYVYESPISMFKRGIIYKPVKEACIIAAIIAMKHGLPVPIPQPTAIPVPVLAEEVA